MLIITNTNTGTKLANGAGSVVVNADGSITETPVGLLTLGKVYYAAQNGLAAALAAAGSNGHVVAADAQAVTVATTVPAGVTLEVERGGLLTFSGSGALTFSAGSFLRAGNYQIFAGTAKAVHASSGICPEVCPEWWGAKADGATASAYPIAEAAILASGMGGGVVALQAGTYAIDLPVGESIYGIKYLGVTFRGRGKWATTLLHTSTTAAVMFFNVAGEWRNCAWESMTIDGAYNVVGVNITQQPLIFIDCWRLTFRDVAFRRFVSPVWLTGGTTFRFTSCTFFGTAPGVMPAGMQDPTAVATASYTSGLLSTPGTHDILVQDCTFHFCQMGLQQSGTSANTKSSGLSVLDCRFRADWWDGPYILARFTPTAYTPSTRVLTVAGGGLNAVYGNSNYQVFSIPVAVATGTAFSTITENKVIATVAFAGAQTAVRVGDVIETADGKRAEVLGVGASGTALTVYLQNWESTDTFESSLAPAAATAFRITRYYASVVAPGGTDTTITLYSDPVNVFSGERLVADAGLSPVGVVCNSPAFVNYAGVQLSGGQAGAIIRGNRFRGSRSDQISLFYADHPVIEGNVVEYGEDEGVTITSCTGPVVRGNQFRFCGTAAVYSGSSTAAVIEGNHVHSWALTNTAVRGAFTAAYPNGLIAGNTADYEAGAGFGGGSSYVVELISATSAGCRVSGNSSGTAKTGDLWADAVAGAFVMRDVVVAGGLGAVPTAPAIAATTVAVANPYPYTASVYVSGGTVTAIAVAGVTTGLTSGLVRVPAGQTVTVTYSVAPTWKWMGD